MPAKGLLYLVCDASPVSSSVAAAIGEVWLADVKLTYQMRLPELARPVVMPPGVGLDLATTVTRSLEVLACQSGEYSRFRRDPKIAAASFEALYSHWLSQAVVEGNAWIASSEAGPSGLLAFGIRHDRANIELLAVSPACRRRHIGRILLQLAEREARRQGHYVLQVLSQGTNQTAQQFYERYASRIVRTEYIYHLWL